MSERTPNWPCNSPHHHSSDRFSSLTLTIKIKYDGAGLSRDQVERICQKVEKTVKGRSKRMTVHAFL